MKVLLLSGTFACCGNPHLIGAAVGDFEAFRESIPSIKAVAEAGMGRCTRLDTLEIYGDQFEELIAVYHKAKYPELVAKLAGAITEAREDFINDQADKASGPASVVADLLKGHKP